MDATSQPPVPLPDLSPAPAPVRDAPNDKRWTQAMLRQLVSVPPGGLFPVSPPQPVIRVVAPVAQTTERLPVVPHAIPVVAQGLRAAALPSVDRREFEAPANIEALHLDLARAPRELLKSWLDRAGQLQPGKTGAAAETTPSARPDGPTPARTNPFLSPARFPTPAAGSAPVLPARTPTPVAVTPAAAPKAPTPAPGTPPVPARIPTPPELAGLGPGEPVQEEELRQRLTLARLVDHFARLGVERTATVQQIREAFLKLSRQYHPHRLASNGQSHLVAAAQELFAMLREAHDVLSDGTRRARYLADIEGGTPVRLSVEEAKAAYQRGLVHLRRLNLRLAETELTRAVEADPRPEYLAELAWTVHSQGDPRLASKKRAESLLAQALRDPRECSDRVFYLAAQFSKANRDVEQAKRYLRHALARNATNVEARRELRALERVG